MSETDTKQAPPQTLEQWTRVLCEQEMPIFSNTAQNVYSTLDDSKKGAMELAAIILQDPNLTAKLLKVSNSVHYNPSKQKMSTISRAIVILGCNLVRELTVACSYFESIIDPTNKQKANQEIAHAIHSAVQAKQLAITLNDKSPEEVFIAALLNNIGSVAFWCFGGKQCQYISELLESGQYSKHEAEEKVLGFTLKELGKDLCHSWNLGGLIEQAINKPDAKDDRLQTIRLAREATEAIEQGWNSDAMNNCLQKLEKWSGQSIATCKARLKQNTETAISIAGKFGAHDASQFIAQNSTEVKQKPVDNDAFEPNKIQFQILQDIAQHLNGQINLNTLFQMVVEGIHRSLKMDRTLFCLLSANKKTLNEKLAIGWMKSVNQGKISIELSAFPPNLFFKAIESEKAIWARLKDDKPLYTPGIINHIGRNDCFLLPVRLNEKPIGLIYCDRSVHKKPLTDEDFKTAKHFSQQANIGLALYKTNQ